jgi:hypothetical protein
VNEVFGCSRQREILEFHARGSREVAMAELEWRQAPIKFEEVISNFIYENAINGHAETEL